jgi:DNA-directed RNA polymerase subunit K/omega
MAMGRRNLPIGVVKGWSGASARHRAWAYFHRRAQRLQITWRLEACPERVGSLPFLDLFSRGRSPPMERTLPQDLVRQVGGSFLLTALLQKRVRELVRGQKPLFETRERNYIKIAHEELKRGLIELVPDEEEQQPQL